MLSIVMYNIISKPNRSAGFLCALILGAFSYQGRVFAIALAGEQGTASATVTVGYSQGIPEILKMVDAKVDAGVIKAYIKNSTVPYHPTATDIIALKDRGVGDDIVTALIHRGGEVRAAEAAAIQPDSPAPYRTAPAYGTSVAPPSYPYVLSDYYNYADYGYPWYSSYGYPYSYSWYGWPSFYFGFGYPYYRFSHYPYYYHRYPFYGGYPYCYGRYGGIQVFNSSRTGFRSFANQPWRPAGGITVRSSSLGSFSGSGGFRSSGHGGSFRSGGGGSHGGRGGWH